MTTEESNIVFEIIERALHTIGFLNIKRWVEYKPGYTIVALEVYSSPILIDENIKKIEQLVAKNFASVTGNTNQSYILIKKHDNRKQG